MPNRLQVLICLLLAAAVGGCSADATSAEPRDDANRANPSAGVAAATAPAANDPPASAPAANDPPATAPVATEPDEDAPDIDPGADAALKRMSATLSAAKTFKVHSTADVEMRTAGGQLAQFSRDTTMTFSRPNLLMAEVKRGNEQRRIWHKGTELTVLDVKQKEYAVLPTPESLEETLDKLADDYDVIIPLDDLLYPDVYQGLTDNVETGSLLGQETIDGHKCDHLIFTQENIDWQIWIDTGEQAVPRKIVITYKDDADRPQFEAVLDQWQLNVAVDPAEFAPKIPEGAKKVELDDLLASDEGD